MKNSLVKAFWAISDRFSVRMKIMGIALTGIFLMGILATVQTNSIIDMAMTEDLEKQGISIARDVAARSTDYIFTNNLFALLELVEDTMENNEDVSYIMILDITGRPLVHTFAKGIPAGLREINSVGREERHRTIKFETEEGIIQDVAVPIFEGRAGIVRVGMSHQGIKEKVLEATQKLLGGVVIISILGIIAAIALTMVLTMPLKQMVQATGEVAAGNYKAKVPEWWSKDELGQLSQAFNHMTQKLDRSHQELQRYSEKIIRHNKELATYNAVVRTVNSSLELEKILATSLEQLMEILHLNDGKIMALDKDRQRFTFGFSGRRGKRLTEISNLGISEGSSITAIYSKLPVIYQDGNMIKAYIPLLANQRAVGLLVIRGKEEDVNKNKVDFLFSVGSQIGIAIENSMLWNDVKEKDDLRGKLLQKVITAQEAERKRIARELHDETSQSLSSFLLGLKLIEGAQSLEQVKARTGELRELVAHTLDGIHNLALELRPTILDDLGLLAALDRYTSSIAERAGIHIELQVLELKDIRLIPEAETAIYRIVQEALTNVVKYAQAKNVNILLANHGTNMTVIIEDDGLGFDVNKLQKPSLKNKHLGLFGMEERATIIGGMLAVESEPNEGTTIYFSVPVERVTMVNDQSNAG